MKVFGLTGGIGCGKSTVSKHWAEQGLPIIDADLLSRQAVDPEYSENPLKSIDMLFGNNLIREDGTLDRAKLGQIVFNDLESLQILEGILARPMEKLFIKELNKHREAGEKLVCYDNAVLVEKCDYPRHYSQYRPIVVVKTTPEIQVERLRKRHPEAPIKDIMSRIMAQMPQGRRYNIADYIIDNSGSKQKTLEDADYVLRRIIERWT